MALKWSPFQYLSQALNRFRQYKRRTSATKSSFFDVYDIYMIIPIYSLFNSRMLPFSNTSELFWKNTTWFLRKMSNVDCRSWSEFMNLKTPWTASAEESEFCKSRQMVTMFSEKFQTWNPSLSETLIILMPRPPYSYKFWKKSAGILSKTLSKFNELI